MQPPPLPDDEEQRVASLHMLRVLDTREEERFDRLTRLASRCFDVPMALVTLVDTNRQWFKSCFGLDIRETHRDFSFCGHAILNASTLVVQDTLLDQRFVDNPLVIGEPFIRFYAGQPIRLASGMTLGTFCILDTQPRYPSQEDLRLLKDLAKMAEHEIGLVEYIRLQQRMHEAEQRNRLVLDAALDAIVTWDSSGQIVDLNRQAEALFGWSREEARGMLMTEMMPEDARASFLQEMAVFQETGAGSLLKRGDESRGRHRTGAVFPIEISIASFQVHDGVSFTGFIRDITARKLAESQVRQLASIVESSIDAIFGQDAEGRILSWNQGAEKLFGYRREEVLGKPGDTFVPNTTSQNYAALFARIQSGETVRPVETIHFTREGQLIQVSVRLSPLRDAAGQIVGASSIVHDITELKRTQEALKAAKDSAEAANRAKTHFLANMSHEIRTPMTAIIGFTDILLEESKSRSVTPEQYSALTTVRQNAEHLLSLINDILDISKIEAGKIETEIVRFSTTQLLSEVMSLMRVRAESKGLPMKLEYEGAIPETIETDPMRLRQTLINLLGNAIKFTEVGGVRLVVRLIDRETSDPKMQFGIVDTGIGMSTDQLGRLFQPFMQADASTTRKYGGTGLGLMICKRLAEMLGGGITVQSQPGKGSAFLLTVATGPLEDVRMLACPTEALSGAELQSRRTPLPPTLIRLPYRVLLAEDGPDNQRLITFHLKKAGADVTIAENGQTAVERVLEAQHEGKPFDVVLMDMQMPVLDGYGATRLLRSRGYRGPIVALTAHAMEGDRQKCLQAGCNEYATKPIDRGRLLELVALSVLERQF